MHTRLFPAMVLLLLSAMTASAQSPSNRLTFDIGAVIERLAVEMDKEFIVDPRLAGVTGLASTTGEDADYETLLAVLRSNEYVAIEVGDQIRFVSEATARSEPSPIVQEDDPRISDHAVVTRVIDISDIRFPDIAGQESAPVGAAAQLVPVLRPLMSTSVGTIAAIPGINKLVVVDRYDNVRRITAIVDELRQ